MKIWDGETGKPVTAVEPPARINHSVILENTGLAFMALEQEKMQGYFLPTLGPAPRWCSFLDNLTEELEENETDTLYDDYKFLTLEEVTISRILFVVNRINVPTNLRNFPFTSFFIYEPACLFHLHPIHGQGTKLFLSGI